MDEHYISWNQIPCRSIMCVHFSILAISFRFIVLGHWIMKHKLSQAVGLCHVQSTLSSSWNISPSSVWGWSFHYHVSEYSPAPPWPSHWSTSCSEHYPSWGSTMSAYFPVCRREYPTTGEHQTFLSFSGSESLFNPNSSDLMFLTGKYFSVPHFRIRQPSGSLFRHWCILSIPCNHSRFKTSSLSNFVIFCSSWAGSAHCSSW